MKTLIENKVGLLILAGCILFVGTGVYLIRKPQLNAKKIQLGDSPARVHQIMGNPTETYQSTGELHNSILSPMSYVFCTLDGSESGIDANKLPNVQYQVDWFEWLSAGTLVYYDENGVTQIYWGGT